MSGFPFVGLTHDGTTNRNDDLMPRIIEFKAQMFIDLINKLDAVTDTDGNSLLHHTVVLWGSDSMRNHSHEDVWALLGGGMRELQMGQIVNARNRSTNDLLATVRQYMTGEESGQYEEFGEGAFNGLFV